MTPDPAPLSEIPGPPQRPALTVLIGWTVTAVATLVMLGWVVRVPWMVQIVPGAVAMVFSNALCLALLGVALILTTVPQRWCKPVQTVIGIGVLLVGATVMVQYRFDLALALDLAGMHTWLNDNPGRMAPNTALAHALAGLTVLLTTHARPGMRALPGLIGAFAVAMVGITGLVGYRLQPELLYGWDIQTRMALHTGTAFVLLGIGYATTVYRNQRLDELFRQREDLRVGLLGAGLMVFVGLAGGLAAFTLLQGQMESVLRNGMKASFNNRQDHIVTQIPALIQATRDFANRPGIQRELANLRAAPGNRVALQYIKVALSRHVVTGPVSGRLFDAHGQLLVSAGPADDAAFELPLQQTAGASLLWNGRSAMLRAAHPVVTNGVSLGRVELVYALPVLTHMVKGAQETSQSGEMQLCAMSGLALRCLPMRLAPQRTELPSVNRTGPTPMARALASESGVVLDTDYRGERVLTVFGPVGNLGLGMALKVDIGEIYAPVRQRFEVMLFVIGLISAAGVLLLRARLVPLVRRLTLSEKRYRGLLEQAPDGIFVADLDGRYTEVNDAGCRMLGYARNEIIGKTIFDLIPPADVGRLLQSREQMLQGGVHVAEWTLRRRDGNYFPAEVSAKILPDGRWQGFVRDISRRQRALQELRDSEQRWQFALEGARDGVWDWNLVTDEVYFSPQWKRMLGYEESDIAGSLAEWDKRVHPDDKAQAYADIEKHLKGEMPYYQNEHRVLCKDGTYKWILDRGMVVARDADGKPTRMIGTHTDISERKRAEETIRELSLVDDLTGLRNRRGFFVLGELQLSLALRLGSMVVLYFVDIDGMKRINDELGHEQGDRALADIAQILRATFRETDLIARLGGDEFVVLALESEGVEPTAAVARFEEQLSQHNGSAHRPYRLAASMGVAQHGPGSAETLAELLHRSDTEMYRVKQRRRAG